MTDTQDSLVLKLLREMRADLARMDQRLTHMDKRQEETNLKIETLAGRMVSMHNGIEGLRADVRMIAIAVDGHAARLDKMEETLERFKH